MINFEIGREIRTKAPTVQYTLLSIYGKYCIYIRICIGLLREWACTVNIQYTVTCIWFWRSVKKSATHETGEVAGTLPLLVGPFIHWEVLL